MFNMILWKPRQLLLYASFSHGAANAYDLVGHQDCMQAGRKYITVVEKKKRPVVRRALKTCRDAQSFTATWKEVLWFGDTSTSALTVLVLWYIRQIWDVGMQY